MQEFKFRKLKIKGIWFLIYYFLLRNSNFQNLCICLLSFKNNVASFIQIILELLSVKFLFF